MINSKKKLLFCILICKVAILSGFNKDSLKLKYSINLGRNSIMNNGRIYQENAYKSFDIGTYLPDNSFNIGAKIYQPYTELKNIAIGLQYFYWDTELLYIDFLSSDNNRITKARFHGFEFSNVSQYEFRKWMNINLGLHHYLNVATRVKDKQMGRDFKLLKENNAPNINRYAFGFMIGADFNIYKKWGAEFFYNKSFTNLFRFEKSNETTPQYKNKFKMIQINLNYKI